MPTPYVEAARRMFKDAESLFNNGRMGTPDHLYGMAYECALKAVLCGYGIISGTTPSRSLKVHIDKLWDEYSSVSHGRGMPALGANPFINWKAEHRYDDDSVFSPTRVANHRIGALEGMRSLQIAEEQGKVS